MQATTQTLVPPSDYQAQRPQVFPSPESLRWFERAHRAELIQRGALLMPNGRKLVDPQLFDAAVRDIGRRMAARRAGIQGATPAGEAL